MSDPQGNTQQNQGITAPNCGGNCTTPNTCAMIGCQMSKQMCSHTFSGVCASPVACGVFGCQMAPKSTAPAPAPSTAGRTVSIACPAANGAVCTSGLCALNGCQGAAAATRYYFGTSIGNTPAPSTGPLVTAVVPAEYRIRFHYKIGLGGSYQDHKRFDNMEETKTYSLEVLGRHTETLSKASVWKDGEFELYILR